MSTRRRLATVAVVALAGASATQPALAAFEVSGAGSFNRAPVLEPGDYADTIQTTEDLFYAVTVRRGQRVTIGAVLRRDRGEKPTSQAELRVRIYNASRQEIPSAYGVNNLGGQGDVSASTESPVATDGETSSESQTQLAPGTYFVSINLNDPFDALGRREIPLEFRIGVGQGVDNTTKTLVGGLALIVGFVLGLRAAVRQARRHAYREARRRARSRGAA